MDIIIGVIITIFVILWAAGSTVGQLFGCDAEIKNK
jgi:hypothetical protein